MFPHFRAPLRSAILISAFAALVLSGCNLNDNNNQASNNGDETTVPTFTVDDTLVPDFDQIMSIDGSASRPVAALTDKSDIKVHFVENELIVTGDAEAAQALADRWNGEIIRTIDGIDRTIESTGTEISIPAMHVLRVDASSADVSILGSEIKKLDQRARGEHRISSQAGRQLMTVAAMERNSNGLDIGINWILQGDDVSSRTTSESSNSADSAYTPNAFEWPYMNRGSTQDIGAGEAMRMLEAAGKTSNQVTIAVADGGFRDRPDFPSSETYPANWYDIANPANCSSGNPCPWHGTHVAETALAIPDNGIGVAGPAGGFADAIFIQGPSDIASLIEYLSQWLNVSGNRPEIINISASGRLPASAALFLNVPVDGFGVALRQVGILVIASAGNKGKDVDAEDCFLGCWEEATWIPCETTDVMCVGGLAWDSNTRDSGSNYGSDPSDCCTVDIFGPYTVWTSGDPAPGDDPTEIRKRSGTSYSAPFVSGVAAMVMAADPSLSPGQVQNILERTAHTNSPDGNVPRWVDAEAAVRDALGDGPPFALITAPSDGDEFTARTLEVVFSADIEDAESAGSLTFEWRSDMDGVLGQSSGARAELQSYGTHTIELTVTDPFGYTVRDSITIEAVNEAPVVEIVQPTGTAGTTFFEGETIRFTATSSDENVEMSSDSTRRLEDSQINWESSIDGSLVSGHEISGSLSQGTHTITVTATDDGGATDTDSVQVVVEPPPVDDPPSIVIDNPSDDQTYYQAQGSAAPTVGLQATATDNEDGTLDGGSIVWTTDRDDLQSAQLGTGASLSVPLDSDNTVGCSYHIITATATDSGGNSRSDQVRVCIYYVLN